MAEIEFANFKELSNMNERYSNKDLHSQNKTQRCNRRWVLKTHMGWAKK